ncbi:hypothetical protein GCK72_009193 [Caenorhabditis remanei]|uniref:Uncharacterized protein n=1 Tax=Caenorhabditis remanei TaxID=31234 RepID=A0A6A5GZJ2_CAERE|nr:hypothetical protein GCK72_009193 [Caenorhabditis remanei]KAF1760940.1 hypothetical protein GCK72_009193 [Caenorhabditis remanei]
MTTYYFPFAQIQNARNQVLMECRDLILCIANYVETTYRNHGHVTKVPQWTVVMIDELLPRMNNIGIPFTSLNIIIPAYFTACVRIHNPSAARDVFYFPQPATNDTPLPLL